MSKKSLTIIILAVLLIVVAIAVYVVLVKTKSNLDYTELTYKPIETTIKIGVPKEKGFIKKEIGTQGNMIEYSNEELELKMLLSLYDRNEETYKKHKAQIENEKGFKNIKINDFEGFEYNTSEKSKVIVLVLGKTDSGIMKVYEVEILLYGEKERTIDEVVELEEMKTLLESVELVDFIEYKPVELDQQENEDINKNLEEPRG